MRLINYKDKICVVTGAASGIGLATTKLLLELGAKVYALDLNELNIGDFMSIKCDLSSKESIDIAFKKIPEHIDCFFGIAGLSGAKTNYHKTFTVNYIANKYITNEYLKSRMANGGAIVYVTSVAGSYWDKYSKEYQLFTRAKTWEEMMNVLDYQAKEDTIGIMAYPFSKRAMNHYMAETAIELGSKGIRVNALLPGSTDTGMKREFEVEAGGKEALLAQTGLAQRLADPEEMAKPLLFLNSDMASFISGICLTVDYCNDAMIKLKLKKNRLDMPVGSKIFNLGFIQKQLKKQIEGLNDVEEREEIKHEQVKKEEIKIDITDMKPPEEDIVDEVIEEIVDDSKLNPDLDELKDISNLQAEEVFEEIDVDNIVNHTDEDIEEIKNEVKKSFLSTDDEEVDSL